MKEKTASEKRRFSIDLKKLTKRRLFYFYQAERIQIKYIFTVQLIRKNNEISLSKKNTKHEKQLITLLT